VPADKQCGFLERLTPLFSGTFNVCS